MPYTLSDEEISLLLHHLLSHPADPALVPIIHSLHFSLVASRTTSLHNTANSGELFRDFLGSPEDFNDWDTPSLPNPSLPNPSLSNPSHSDLLDDHYSVDVANFERLSDVISDYISCCDYGDPAAISSTNDYGISPSLVFGAKIHEVSNTFVNIIVLLISIFPDCKFQCFGSRTRRREQEGGQGSIWSGWEWW